MTSIIQAIGTATPELSIAQSDAAQVAQTFVYGNDESANVLPLLFRLTKVKTRGSVLLEPANGDRYRQSFYPAATTSQDRGPTTETRMDRFQREAPPLALQASRSALLQSQVSADQISHLVTVSCTGFHAPGVDISLIKELGLPPTIGRVNVGFMGCHGALNGLRAVQAFVDADPDARVLMSCVELCSLHYYYGWDSEKVVANALFADGAASVVARQSVDTDADNWKLVACESCLLPDSEEEMSWRIGDYGFEMTLSARVPEIIREHLRPWLCDWLAKHGLALEDIQSWAIHPGGPRIIQSVAQSLDLPENATDTSHEVLAEYGNMSSATVLFVIQRMQQASAPQPCVALGFGPGLMAEAALFV